MEWGMDSLLKLVIMVMEATTVTSARHWYLSDMYAEMARVPTAAKKG